MSIDGHKLDGAEWAPTPNMSGEIVPSLIVIHYTATQDGPATVRAMQSPKLRASAHLCIDADGKTWQLVPFNRKAWHAGKSNYKGRPSVSSFSVGIELVNPGPIRWDANDARHEDVYGREWRGGLVEATHKNGSKQFKLWAKYPEAQVERCREICAALVETYGIKDIVGHDDIAPRRKIDPGPAFPMESFKASLFGRDEDGDDRRYYVTAPDGLNVRSGPGVAHTVLRELYEGQRVTLLETDGRWWLVRADKGCAEGWVHSSYLAEV